MIYWEHQNPRFLVQLVNPSGVPYDVWQWEVHEGWLDVIDTDNILEFSPAYSPTQMCRVLRSILVPEGLDQLVVYYYVEGGVRVSLVRCPDPQFFQGLTLQPPDWWSLEEGLTLMQRLLERITILSEAVTTHQRKSPYTRALHLEKRVPGFCSRCGLPDEHHVSHDVPGFDPKKVTFRNPEEARPYMEAFKRHYGGALKNLRDSDLLIMPLPPNKRNLRVIMMEVQSRIEHPVVPTTALDRLLAGGLLDE